MLTFRLFIKAHAHDSSVKQCEPRCRDAHSGELRWEMFGITQNQLSFRRFGMGLHCMLSIISTNVQAQHMHKAVHKAMHKAIHNFA